MERDIHVAVGNASFQQVIISFYLRRCFVGYTFLPENTPLQVKGVVSTKLRNTNAG
jgi:ABC-type iron transport system FetAB permease component